MNYYPVLLDLKDKKALVVGGGKVAERKIETLLSCGALIRLVSRELTANLELLVENGDVLHVGDRFKEQDLDEVFLVIAATDDKKLNRRVSEASHKRGLLVNAVDQPADCNFIVPSIVKRGALLVAISTSGKSPALAKKIRRELESQFGYEYGVFLALMGELRGEILSLGLPSAENSRIFHEIVDSDILNAIASKQWVRVESILSGIIPEGIALSEILKHL